MDRRQLLQLLALAGFFVGVVFAAFRVRSHASGELAFESEAVELGAVGEREGSTEISSRLASVSLSAGETVSFELCADDSMRAEVWRNAFVVVVWAPGSETLGLRVPLDARDLSLARRGERAACLPLGSGEIPTSEPYVVDLVHRYAPIPSELAEVRVWGRVVARRPLGALDALAFALIFVSVFVFLATFLEAPSPGVAIERRAALRVGLPGIALGLFSIQLVFWLPSAGPLSALGRGLLVGLAQVVVAVRFSRGLGPPVREVLGLGAPPRRALPAVFLALTAGVGVYGVARLLLRIVPSTGEAPIAGFVAWPSGALTFAVVGLLTPVAEEIFFRGFVFKSLEAFGRWLAVLGSAGLFAILHLEQTFGQWGAFSAIAVAGLVFSLLRAATGSTLVPAFAHLVYNAALSLSAFD